MCADVVLLRWLKPNLNEIKGALCNWATCMCHQRCCQCLLHRRWGDNLCSSRVFQSFQCLGSAPALTLTL